MTVSPAEKSRATKRTSQATDADGRPAPVLSRRALNRALLARQMLLARERVTAAQAVERFVGLQGQEPQAPYVALAARLADFDPHELSDLLATRRAVRGVVMRCTVHLVTAADWLQLRPLMAPVLGRNFKGSPFSKQIADLDHDELLAAGRALLAEQPRTRVELGRLLAERWPHHDQTSLAHAASLLTPAVQVPPRGLWRQAGQARWALAEDWLGAAHADAPDIKPIVRRYLRAFGPASVADIQAWCGLTRLRETIEQMRAELRSFSDEQGRELLDVPDGLLPDPDTPAPARILAPFDNIVLGHAERSRIIDRGDRDVVFKDRLMRTFLVDGFVAGTWRVDGDVLQLASLQRLGASQRKHLAEEAANMGRVLGRGGRSLRVTFAVAA